MSKSAVVKQKWCTARRTDQTNKVIESLYSAVARRMKNNVVVIEHGPYLYWRTSVTHFA